MKLRNRTQALLAGALLACAACQATHPKTKTDAHEAPGVPEAKAQVAATPASSPATQAANPFHKDGFVVHEEDGRLWVFREGSSELEQFVAGGELAKHVVRPGAGPAGKTLKGPDGETLLAYSAAREGFVTLVEDGRLWVFEQGSPELDEYRGAGELAKHVTRIGAGPLGTTVKSPDRDTLDAYLFGKPGFVVIPEDGRLWVFAEGSEELEQFRSGGELAKHYTGVNAFRGKTVKAPDKEVVLAYCSTVEGFTTLVEDGRLWVFRDGAPEYEEYLAGGELAKHVTRVNAGPLGTTIKGPDTDTLDAYVRTLD